ncbi:hypothetical protein BDA99DRAFT_531672 [Phascolomyces articulosus]|uniref:Uncharacterized protein n=1 Tax=Phascolomyces articulosus TaxID=60185 RepID=A0AAD5KSM2_9FUNG|nr:hypothetical protein BDA99DRAFT_531672 [Phascolomyces articulosus]
MISNPIGCICILAIDFIQAFSMLTFQQHVGALAENSSLAIDICERWKTTSISHRQYLLSRDYFVKVAHGSSNESLKLMTQVLLDISAMNISKFNWAVQRFFPEKKSNASFRLKI